jgi:hypothetical protein
VLDATTEEGRQKLKEIEEEEADADADGVQGVEVGEAEHIKIPYRDGKPGDPA